MRGFVNSNRRIFSFTVSVPRRHRWLESGETPAMRTPLAALLKFVAAVCKLEEEFPPPAANAKAFRAQARPQPSDDSPACPTSLAGPGTSSQHRPRHVAALSLPWQKAAPNLIRPAGGVRSARALPYSSQHRPLSTKTVTDRNPPFAFTIPRCLQPFRLA